MKMDKSELREYIQEEPADRERLAGYVIKAKGPRRSMRQYAFDCGVSPSTLSRLISKTVSGEASDELLYKIAANADPESNVSLDMLMYANGKRKKSDYISADSVPSLEKKAVKILINELLKNGYSVRIIQQDDRDKEVEGKVYPLVNMNKVDNADSMVNVINTDDAISVDNVLNPYQPELWIVTDAISVRSRSSKDEKADSHSGTVDWVFAFALTRNLNLTDDAEKKIFPKLISIWEQYYSNEIRMDKISVVVNNEILFEKLKKAFGAVRLRNCISVILVNISEEYVVREYSIPMENVQEFSERRLRERKNTMRIKKEEKMK